MIPTSLHVLAILALVLSASADAQQANGVRRQYAGDDLPIELKFVSFLDFAAPDDRPDDHVALEHVADAVGIRYVVNGRIDDERLQRIRVVSIYLQGVRAEIREERRQLEAEILCSGNRDFLAELAEHLDFRLVTGDVAGALQLAARHIGWAARTRSPWRESAPSQDQMKGERQGRSLAAG